MSFYYDFLQSIKPKNKKTNFNSFKQLAIRNLRILIFKKSEQNINNSFIRNEKNVHEVCSRERKYMRQFSHCHLVDSQIKDTISKLIRGPSSEECLMKKSTTKTYSISHSSRFIWINFGNITAARTHSLD
ncbi:hypothetical protein BpHYR1_035640 [Brachionus plicatilis]|uniref:Uncharacterized protein n=1 Tax=Brachionus plicatilis TaxID=10195 RepID=A0A3M7RQN3_BRAPC|nr:hypothetical protein BpHYR1_035640 [Brachionus plicatilis]